MRLFIALELPQTAVRHAAGVIGQLKRSGPDIKWVKPDTLHVTLKFLGEVDTEDADDLAMDLGGAFNDVKALELGIGGCGAFPNPRQPEVIWLGLTGDTQGLARLASKTEAVCEAHGFPREKRAFKPHLTLGRARRGKGPKPNFGPLGAAITAMARDQGPRFRTGTIALMQSTLTPKGAIYNPVMKFNLG